MYLSVFLCLPVLLFVTHSLPGHVSARDVCLHHQPRCISPKEPCGRSSVCLTRLARVPQGKKAPGKLLCEAPSVLCYKTPFLEVNSALIWASASPGSVLLCEAGQDNLLISESIAPSQPFLPAEN